MLSRGKIGSLLAFKLCLTEQFNNPRLKGEHKPRHVGTKVQEVLEKGWLQLHWRVKLNAEVKGGETGA